MIEGLVISYGTVIINLGYLFKLIHKNIDFKETNFHFNAEMLKSILLFLIPIINMIYGLYLTTNLLARENSFIDELYKKGILVDIDSKNSHNIKKNMTEGIPKIRNSEWERIQKISMIYDVPRSKNLRLIRKKKF